MNAKRWYGLAVLALVSLLLMVACEPEVVTVTVEKTVEVEKEKIVTQVTEVEKEVIKEVVKVATPTPETPSPWITLGGTWDAPPAFHGNPFAPGGIGVSYWYAFEPFFYYVPVSEEILPMLAESFEEDDEGFTVYLQKGVVWHDGEPFTAEDVRCTFLLRKLQNASIWNYIEDVEIVDDFTVFFPWKERTYFAKQFFAVERITAPYHIYGEWSDQVPDIMDDPDAQQELLADLQEYRPDLPVGTGPFYVETVTASDFIMPKFPDYRFADQVKFDGMRYLLTRGHEVGMAYALSGETHGCGAPLRPDYWDALEARRPDLRVIAVTDLSEFGVTYNMRREPFSDPLIRQALTHATDREQLAQAGFPVGDPVTTYDHQVLKSFQDVWFSDDAINAMTPHGFDQEMAASMLEEAGFSQNGDGQWLTPAGEVWEIEINCPAGYGDWVLGCENLAAQWTGFGINAVCQPIDNSVWWPSATAGEFDVGFLWAGVFWSTAHPYTSLQRHYLGDGGARSGITEMIEDGTLELTGIDGEVIDVEGLIEELGTLPAQERQQEIVENLGYAANELLSQMIWVEKQFHFCLFEDEIAGFPATDDPLWLLAPGGQERVWVWMIINGMIEPK